MSAKDLLVWYDKFSRKLPWRENQDPYRVWVSEIMLQQTRVETVIPYYLRFLEKFPDVEALGKAPVDRVLSLWSGLGYYRRARQLHEAAGIVVQDGGEFPRTAAKLQELPGIGAYTAAAVASIVFGEVIPVMDGNVERVLSRRLALGEDPKKSLGRKKLLAGAADLLEPQRPGDSNQALMELGATVCTPRNPKCGNCPLSKGCRGRELGQVEKYPMPSHKRPQKRLRHRIAVVLDGERVLLFRRPQDSEILAGTWELPWVKADGRSPQDSELDLHQRYGGDWTLGPRTAEVRHSITFRSLQLEVHRASVRSGQSVAEGPEAGWFAEEEIKDLPTSSQVPKVLKVAGPRVADQKALW